MHRTHKTRILLATMTACMIGVCARAWEPPAPPEMDVPECKTPPLIDGELNDDCWKGLKPLSDFYLFKGEGKTSDKQNVRVTHDDQWLYLAFELELPHPKAIQVKTTGHDGNVSRDDSVEVFTDAGTDGKAYLHYMLNVANDRAERIIFMQGKSKDLSWNMPWRSATKVTDKGWQAEMALPLAVLGEKGSLNDLRINIGINRVLLTLNYMNVPMASEREIASWAPVKASFHEPRRFGKVKGLDKAKAAMPFLMAARSVKTGSYKIDENGQFYYEVTGAVDRFTDAEGAVLAVVEDKPGSVKGETVEERLDLGKDESVEFSVKVPVKVLSDRTAELTVRDPETGEVLQNVPLHDMAGLCLMRSYARYSYYTAENEAEIVCEIGLPKEELKKVRLAAKDAEGKTIAETDKLKSRTMLSVPIRKLDEGEHGLTVELLRGDGDVAVSQKVTLVKRKPNPGREWKIDHGNKCILNNGEPFFPFGIMCRALDTNGVMAADIGEMGFNTVVRFGTYKLEDIETLYDQGKKNGFYVVEYPNDWKYDPPPEKAPRKDMSAEERWQWYLDNMLRPGIMRVKDNPMLMTWDLADEPQDNLMAAARILKLYKEIHSLDGYHPTFVLYIPPVPAGETFSRNCDIFVVDPYWVPGGGPGSIGNPNCVGRATWFARQRADRDLKLAWITPCAELWSGTRMRVFNKNEQRVQTYLSLINGAGGLLYFVYPFKHQVSHDAFKELSVDMKVLGSACAAGEVSQTIRFTPTPCDPINNIYPDVQARLKRNPRGGYILLAANWKPYPVDVSYTVSLLGKSGTVKPLFGRGDKCKVKDSMFSDSIPAMDTRAYVIDGPRELAEPVDITVAVTSYPKKAEPFYTRVAFPDTGKPGNKNILRNSSFEECSFPGMPDYYRDFRANLYRQGDTRGDCGWGVVTDHPYHGKNCIRFEGRYILFGVTPDIKKPETFTFSAWVKGDGSPKQRVRFYGPMDKKETFTLTNEWQRISGTTTLSPDTPRGGYLFGFSAGSANVVWIDAIQFEKGEKATEYEE